MSARQTERSSLCQADFSVPPVWLCEGNPAPLSQTSSFGVVGLVIVFEPASPFLFDLLTE